MRETTTKLMNKLQEAHDVEEFHRNAIYGKLYAPQEEGFEDELRKEYTFKLERRLSGFTVKIELVIDDRTWMSWASYDGAFDEGIAVFEMLERKIMNEKDKKRDAQAKELKELFNV